MTEENPTDSRHRSWTTGIFKNPVVHPVYLDWTGLEGDDQADLHNHGGPDKALCVYPADHYPYWQSVLSLSDFHYGAFGENFTVSSLDESNVCIGDAFCIGDVIVQVSQPRQPCWKLARKWARKNLTAQVVQTGFTGWYFRVMQPGIIEAGMPIEVVERPCPQWTLNRANQIMYHEKGSHTDTAELAFMPLLSTSWRETLQLRLQ